MFAYGKYCFAMLVIALLVGDMGVDGKRHGNRKKDSQKKSASRKAHTPVVRQGAEDGTDGAGDDGAVDDGAGDDGAGGDGAGDDGAGGDGAGGDGEGGDGEGGGDEDCDVTCMLDKINEMYEEALMMLQN